MPLWFYAGPAPAPSAPDGWTLAGSTETAADLTAAARLPLDALWVDRALLEQAEARAALPRFRVARPHCRIVIGIPGDAMPPDPTLAQAVALGIYDITTAPPAAALPTPAASYADAARWAGWDNVAGPGPTTSPAADRIEVIQVERRVPLTDRPALIGVWAAAPGCGATTLVVTLAALLAGHGPVAVLDAVPAPAPLDTAPTGCEALRLLDRWPARAAYRRAASADWLPFARQAHAAWSLLDGGPAAVSDPAWPLADLRIVLLPPAATRYGAALPWLGETAHEQEVTLAAWGPPTLAQLYTEAAPLGAAPTRALPWPDQPSHEAALRDLLGPLWPTVPQPARRWFRPRALQSQRGEL
jgi:hypothetical protein